MLSGLFEHARSSCSRVTEERGHREAVLLGHLAYALNSPRLLKGPLMSITHKPLAVNFHASLPVIEPFLRVVEIIPDLLPCVTGILVYVWFEVHGRWCVHS